MDLSDLFVLIAWRSTASRMMSPVQTSKYECMSSLLLKNDTDKMTPIVNSSKTHLSANYQVSGWHQQSHIHLTNP